MNDQSSHTEIAAAMPLKTFLPHGYAFPLSRNKKEEYYLRIKYDIKKIKNSVWRHWREAKPESYIVMNWLLLPFKGGPHLP